jgi:hypothetical protein
MGICSRCATLFGAAGGTAFVSRLRRKSRAERQAHKTELQDWENEGGTQAPSPDPPDWRVTTGSA